MTNDQFEVLVKLMRGDATSPASIAARAVLVENKSQADAMRSTGATRSTISDAVKRYSIADNLIRKAYLGEK